MDADVAMVERVEVATAGAAEAVPPGYTRVEGAPFPLLRASLSTGLTLWFAPKSGASSVYASVMIHAGGRYEDAHTSGASHMLEHMLFVGTERWDKEEVRAVIDRAGGQDNGFTGQEQVGYYAWLPEGRIPVALDWLDQVVFHPTLPASEFDREREVVFEERDGHDPLVIRLFREAGLPMSLWESRERALFPGSSRSRRQIGDERSLDGLTVEALRTFYQAHYTAQNADLVVVGDEEPAAVLALAEATFAGIPAGPRLTPPHDFGDIKLGGRRNVWEPMVSNRCEVSFGARGPALDAPDAAAAEVLSTYLDRVLEADLREQRGITYGVRARLSSQSDSGEFTVSVETDCAHKDEVADAIEGLVVAVAAGELDRPRFEEARSARAGTEAIYLDGATSWGDAVQNELAHAAPFSTPVTAAALAEVTPEAMAEVARRWLPPNQTLIWFSRGVLTVAQAWGVGLAIGVPLLGWLGRKLWRWRQARRARRVAAP